MIINKTNINEALKALENSKETLYSVDIETYNPYENAWFMDLSPKQRPLNQLESKMVSLQLYLEDGLEFYFDFNHKQEGEDLRLSYDYLPKILKDCKQMVGHNLAFEYGIFLNHGYDFKGELLDTMIMGVLANENNAQGLKPSVKRLFGHVMPSYAETVGNGTMKDITAEEGFDYGMSDTIWTLKLYKFYLDYVNMDYYRLFEMDLIKIVAKHYRQGQQVDLAMLDKIQAEDIEIKNRLLDEFPELANINLNSPAQVSKFLFKDLGLQPHKVSKKTGVPSTDKESLFELEAKYGETHKVIKAFSEIRKVETRLKLYYKPYPKLIYPDGKIHSQIRQTGTVTGRFSMQAPNLQQLSKRGEGVKVRKVIVPFSKFNHDCIVSIDWSQIEMRIAAHVSQDPKLIDGYRTKKDMHTLSGTNISGLDYDKMKELINKGDKEQKANRQKGKTLNFAALYLAGAARLSKFDLLNCSEAEAENFLAAHKLGYKGYFYDYVNKIMAFLKTNKYVLTIFGRRRRLPDIASPIKALAKSAENQGLNFTIQGSAGELMKLSMLSLDESNLLFHEDYKFIAPVHDEFVWSCKKEKASELIKQAVEIMERTPRGFSVPLIAEASIGINFADQIELKGDFSPKNIERALDVSAGK